MLRKPGLQITGDVGFLCEKTYVTAVVFRDAIKWRVLMILTPEPKCLNSIISNLKTRTPLLFT